MPPEERDRIECLDELYGFLQQSSISVKNMARLRTFTANPDHEVAELGALILEIARLIPGKRNRWLRLARQHRSVFSRAIELLGVEFFEDQLARHGDFNSPLWRILEQPPGSMPI
jgi:hypothetical protein